MRLYLAKTEEYDYDEYDSMIVAAESEEEAVRYVTKRIGSWQVYIPDMWTITELIIEDLPKGIVLASYNAG
jgi:hypothetical protein